MNVLNERLTPQAACLTSLLAMLWGGNNIAIKFALIGFPPFALAAVRFVLGSAFILIWVYVSRVPIRMESGEKQGLFQLAFLFAVQIYLMTAGVHHTLAGRSTVIISTFPFFVALFAHLLLPGDTLNPLKIVGMTLSFLGVTLIFAESFVLGDFQYLFGDLMETPAVIQNPVAPVWRRHDACIQSVELRWCFQMRPLLPSAVHR